MRPPFDALAPEELAEVVGQTQIEFYLAGSVILSEDGGPVTFLRVIHSGAVDIWHEDKLLDLLHAGDTFGHAAMLAGLPPGFEARAAEDALCYRIPAAVARPLLERAKVHALAVGLREPTNQPVAKLIRTATVTCEPMEAIREVARRMTAAGATSAIVNAQGRGYGIVTDRDIRTRIVAAGLPLSAPVSAVMTTPVFSVTPDRLAGEVLFEMLERGIRHAPIVNERGGLVGVVEDADLFAVQPRSWFGARAAIARAGDVDALAVVARRLPRDRGRPARLEPAGGGGRSCAVRARRRADRSGAGAGGVGPATTVRRSCVGRGRQPRATGADPGLARARRRRLQRVAADRLERGGRQGARRTAACRAR